jgi:predicted Zn-dependent peptidase
MPQAANSNWFNAHNFYGDLADLDAATLEDVRKFFATYYAPNNAVLVITGDFEPAQAMAAVNQYFGPIAPSQLPKKEDVSEPRQEREKRVVQEDKLATRPALAWAYHVPPRGTPEWYAMGLLREMLAGGRDGLLYEAIVQKRGLAGNVEGDINELGSQFNVQGPTLLDFYLFHDGDKSPDDILAAADEPIEKLRAAPVDAAALSRAKIKMRAHIYENLEHTYGFGRADLLAAYALFDDAPGKVNDLEGEFDKVTPELLQKTAQEWLRKSNRTVLVVTAGAADKQKRGSAGGAP